MNAKAVFTHPKCEAETKYHNMCTECQRAFDYNNVMMWHRHLQSQVSRPPNWHATSVSNGGYNRNQASHLPSASKTKLQSKWISFPDGNKIKKVSEE